MAENYAITTVDEKIRSTYLSNVAPSPPLTERPLSREVALAVVRALPGIQVKEHDAGHVFLEARDGSYTEMLLQAPVNTAASASVGFRGGHIELIKVVTKSLAARVGTLMLFFGSGQEPLLFTSQAEPGAPPNGGPAERPGNSGAGGGPPSVS